MARDNINCQLCEVAEGETKHHLVPKCKKGTETVRICHVCHGKINSEFTNKELKNKYNTIDSLKEALEGFISWRKKHPNFNGSFKMSNSRKRKGNKYK